MIFNIYRIKQNDITTYMTSMTSRYLIPYKYYWPPKPFLLSPSSIHTSQSFSFKVFSSIPSETLVDSLILVNLLWFSLFWSKPWIGSQRRGERPRKDSCQSLLSYCQVCYFSFLFKTSRVQCAVIILYYDFFLGLCLCVFVRIQNHSSFKLMNSR